MNHWLHIAAAYALTIGGMGGLSLVAWLRMRKAEETSGTVTRSSRAQSRGVGTGPEQAPLDFARDERKIAREIQQ